MPSRNGTAEPQPLQRCCQPWPGHLPTSGMTSSIQVRSWQPCSSPAFYTPPARAFNYSHPGPKGTFAIKAAHTQHLQQPLPRWDPPAPTSGPARTEPEPWECRKQPGGHHNLLGAGRTHTLPGDRVGQGANPPSPADTGMGTTLWDRAKQCHLAPCATTGHECPRCWGQQSCDSHSCWLPALPTCSPGRILNAC